MPLLIKGFFPILPMTDFETQLIAVLQEISNHLKITNDNLDMNLFKIEDRLDTIGATISAIYMSDKFSKVSDYIYRASESIDQVSESIDRVQESIAEH